MANKLPRFIKLSWKLYTYLCVGCCTLLGIALLYIAFSYWNRDVVFHNGVRLTSYFNHPNGFKLLNEHGKTLLKVVGGQVISQDDFVFGFATVLENRKGVTSDFIYKIGWDKPMIFGDEADPSFSDMSKRYGLRWSLDYPPDLLERKAYKKCTEHDGTSECKFRMLDRFWADVESGKEPRYVCNRKQNNQPCGSYSLFKTYLSLLKMPRYR